MSAKQLILDLWQALQDQQAMPDESMKNRVFDQLRVLEVQELIKSLESQDCTEFGDFEQHAIKQSMKLCGMAVLPEPKHDIDRVSGDCICSICGNDFYSHPMDWRVLGYGNVPFLNIICDGTRAKL